MLDWGDLAKTVVGLGAPLVGEALGGPFGATAGKILAQAFNAPDQTSAAVREAISTADWTSRRIHAIHRRAGSENGWQEAMMYGVAQ